MSRWPRGRGATTSSAAVHAHEHAHRGSHHQGTSGGAAPRLAFAYLLPGSAAQTLRLRDPKTGATRESVLRPNGALIYRAELEREPAVAGEDARAVLPGVLAQTPS